MICSAKVAPGGGRKRRCRRPVMLGQRLCSWHTPGHETALCEAVLPGAFGRPETRGRRCKAWALGGSRFCHQHDGNRAEVKRRQAHEAPRPQDASLVGRPRLADIDPRTGLSDRQTACLEAIGRLTAKADRTSLGAVGAALGVWGRAVEGLVHRLQERGMVDRDKGKRVVGGTLRLTDLGHAARRKGSHAAS